MRPAPFEIEDEVALDLHGATQFVKVLVRAL